MGDVMSQNPETLSALLDDEASELELRRVLRDLNEDDKHTLCRWQLARDKMHGHDAMPVPEGFNATLSAALAAEGAPQTRAGWLTQAGRLAVAASVAMVTVVGWQSWQGADSSVTQPMLAQEANQSRPLAEAAFVSRSFLPAPQALPAAQSGPRMNEMLLRHSEMAAQYSSQGVVPYARLVSMDAKSGEQ